MVNCHSRNLHLLGYLLEDSNVLSLLISHQLHIGSETGESGVGEICIGKVAETLVPVVELYIGQQTELDGGTRGD